jgi:enoyl-CoA hydratase/carnithine racemase
METIQLVISNHIATVRLSRGKANAINAVLVNELLECLLELKANEQIRGVLLTGHGEFFSAGLDVVELYQYNETENSVNIRVNSPQISKLDNAELLMKQQDLNDLEDHVIEYHKK